MRTYSLKRHFLICFLFLAFTIVASAQFNSGSTGADGALDTSTMNCPSGNCLIQIPESGVFNFTTINVALNTSLGFRNNSRNTPVILLASGNVVVSGSISVSPLVVYPQPGTIPGPGGFPGGHASGSGFGPGRGEFSGGFGCGGYPPATYGRWVGPLSLVPIVGGSGGAGSVSDFGGGGGGAIVIASSTSISISGWIFANGSAGNQNNGCGPSGSGGAIRLIANAITASGVFSAVGGPSGNGVIRLESTNLNFTGTSSPAAVLSPINPIISATAVPRLSIATVANTTVPTYAGSRFDTIDLLLPIQTMDPIPVGIAASNIPVGTQVFVGFVRGSSSATSIPCSLAGTFQSSSCTATVANLNRAEVTYLLATAAFDPPASLASQNPKGPDQVAKVRLEAVLGAAPKYVFLNSQGKPIDNGKLSKGFLAYFGM